MEKNTMKALVFHGVHDLRLDDVPMPELVAPDDAIVRVTLSTICGSDLHIREGYVPAVGPGTIIGHEFVGEVVAVGPMVNQARLRVGDRVAAACSVSCGNCFFCRKGVTAHCEENDSLLYFGCTSELDGCQAEYVRIPHAMAGLYKIPNTVSDEAALFVGDILSTGYFGAENGDIENGDVVAVMGCGPVGMCALATARLYGPSILIAVDTVESRLAFALEQGLCDVIINPLKEDVMEKIKSLTKGRGADVTIEAAGAKGTLDLAFQTVRKAGNVSVIGFSALPYPIDLNDLWMRNVSLKVGCVNTNNIHKLLMLIERGRLDLTPLITHSKPLNDILEGYDVFGNKKDGCIKWAVTPYDYSRGSN